MRDFINERLEKNPLFAWRVIEEMVLLVPIKQSGPEIRRLYRLKDSVSSRIWELVDGQRTDQEIHQVLCQEFDTEAQRIKRDLLKFFKHLKSIGAVQVATPSAGGKRSTQSMSEQKAKTRRVKEVPIEAKVKGPLRLSIGGIELCLRWKEPRPVNWPHPFYKPFIGEESETICFDIHFSGYPQLNGHKLIFDGEHHWKLYQQDSRYLFEAFDPSTHTRNMLSLVNHDFDRAEVYVDPSSSASPPPWSLSRLMNPLGKWLLVNRLAESGGVMVHGLGIDDGGQGLVFVGPSGSGKSTLARFWGRQKGVRILSDEHLIIRRLGKSFYVYGTPWPGMAARVSPHPVQIQQIFLIEHHPEHRLWEETQGILASSLFSQLFLPRWNHRIIESGVTACEQLVQEVRCQKLGFAKHPSVIDYVRQVKPGDTT
ncbi:MAG: PqqD family peptide modification chaperone [Acidobacteria bacterium]|nr:PqqD family peptide modification chaperone [Acidobacteriota bacterium]